MTEKVEAALNGERPLLAQAGTGTGKSLAYLSAALTAAAEHGRRTVISTATLALQRQILVKDAPVVSAVVEEITGGTPSVEVLKGWNNYVCRHKVGGGYGDEEEPEGLFAVRKSALEEEVARVRVWADDTETGDRDDLDPGVADRVWRHVSVSRLECLGTRCPMKDDCFALTARARAREAEVVVTNHTLLGIAASGSPGVLPEFDALVIDEAHDIVPRATAAASVDLTVASIERVARMARRHAESAVEKLEAAAAQLRSVLDELPDRRMARIPESLKAVAITLGAAAREAVSGLSGDAEDGERAILKADLVVLIETSDRILKDTAAELKDVAWIARDANEIPRFVLAPLDVSDGIYHHLIADRGVVATSATLALGGSFVSAARALGVNEYDAEDFGSPFDYGAQGIVYAASHLPRPARDGISEEALSELVDLVDASGGGVLGLFSSRRGAERAAEHVSKHTKLPVFCQGEDTMSRLVERFRNDDASSLFGTLSLWQGVDVPGDACRLVVIDRIPFPRPDDPMAQARAEVAQAAGRNGFMEVSVNHAALLMAQGAGRLIRRLSDRGVVAILDSRVVHAGYGRFIMQSLPPLWPTTNPDVVRAALRRLAPTAT